ncbi:AB hydrolase-1 domain-containing protein [Fusarium sp. Ph1]|nr:AB hydrolase-1 domain-containing protein [Fusarium sp. Ph1]
MRVDELEPTDLRVVWVKAPILFLKSSGYQVIAPDMLGFGKSSTPGLPSAYALRSVADDVKELAESTVKNKRIILGGHFWDGAVAWRTAMWSPKLLQDIFSIHPPFTPPSSTFNSLDDTSQSKGLGSRRHQPQFRGMALEE